MPSKPIKRVSAFTSDYIRGRFATDGKIGVIFQEVPDLNLWQIAAWHDSLDKISLKTPKLFIQKLNDKLLYQNLILKKNIDNIISNYNFKLKKIEFILNKYNINDLHKRGFSIITKKGIVINSIKDLTINDNIIIKLLDGYADSRIISIDDEK